MSEDRISAENKVLSPIAPTTSARRDAKVYVAGHAGLVGSALVRKLEALGYTNIITKSHKDLDLTNQAATRSFFEEERPEIVYLAAAKVGGIGANSTLPAEFIAINLSIALNVIESAHAVGVEKLCNLGSSCIYPREARQPIKEEALLSGYLEPTNEPYAIAKIAAIKLCSSFNKQYGTNFMSLMPTNLYGINDNYDQMSGHVLPALVARFHEAKMSGAKELVMWGDGTPQREFLISDDLAKCAIHLMENYNASDIGEFVNVGSGQEVTIGRLGNTIREVVFTDADFIPPIVWDTTKPNGTPRKRLDLSKLERFGWKAETKLRDGINLAYRDYLSRVEGA